MPDTWTKYLLLPALTGALAWSATAAMAQEVEGVAVEDDLPDLFDDDVERKEEGWSLFQVAVGLAYIDADGVLAVRRPDQEPVTVIDFDRVGLKETDSSHWISMTWRSSSSRWGIWFANWRYDVTGSRTWEQEFSIPENPTFPVGATVESEFDADWYVIEATYSFVQTNSVDAGIGFGLHAVDLESELTAQVDFGNDELEVVRGRVDTLAPLPNIQGYIYWKPAPRWHMVARLGWFGLEYDKYSGQMTNAHYMLSYSISDRISLGAAYQFVSLDVDVDEETYKQLYDIDFDGPMAFLRFRF